MLYKIMTIPGWVVKVWFSSSFKLVKLFLHDFQVVNDLVMTSFVSLGRFSGISRPGTFIGNQRVAATQKDGFKFEVKLF